jgi:drug/metabolite transporter (DMT)-like permease
MSETPSHTDRRQTLLADLGLLYASAIWGSTFIMVKGSLSALTPLGLVTHRFLVAAVITGALLVWQRKPLFRNWRPGLLLGLTMVALYVPQTIGLKYTTAANSGFITGLFVTFVPPLTIMFTRQKPRPAQWLAVGISLAGLWLVTGGIGQINTGDLITLSAALTYALHVLLTDRFARSTEHLELVFQQFLVVGIVSLLLGLAFGQSLAVPSLASGGVIVFLAVFPTLSAFLIQIKAQTITAPVKVSLIFALEPVFAGIFAWTLGGETFIFRQAVGGLLIFLAVFVGTVQPINRRDRKNLVRSDRSIGS